MLSNLRWPGLAALIGVSFLAGTFLSYRTASAQIRNGNGVVHGVGDPNGVKHVIGGTGLGTSVNGGVITPVGNGAADSNFNPATPVLYAEGGYIYVFQGNHAFKVSKVDLSVAYQAEFKILPTQQVKLVGR